MHGSKTNLYRIDLCKDKVRTRIICASTNRLSSVVRLCEHLTSYAPVSLTVWCTSECIRISRAPLHCFHGIFHLSPHPGRVGVFVFFLISELGWCKLREYSRFSPQPNLQYRYSCRLTIHLYSVCRTMASLGTMFFFFFLSYFCRYMYDFVLI